MSIEYETYFKDYILFQMICAFPAKVSQNYTKESNMIFFTGVIIALALEYCNLHRRIALKVMLIIGASPARSVVL